MYITFNLNLWWYLKLIIFFILIIFQILEALIKAL